jgi:hypothetical protein
MPESENSVYDKVIFFVYIAAVGLAMYVYVDQASGGALTRSVAQSMRAHQAALREWSERRKEYRKSLGQVLWQAHEILEDGA